SAHFRGGDVVAIRLKDRVVTEPAAAPTIREERSAQVAVLNRLRALGGDHRRGTHERCLPMGGRDIRELGEEEIDIGVVVAVVADPTRGEDARCPAEDVDGEAGVVGEGDEPGLLGHGARFEERILSEGDPGFFHVGQVEINRGDDLLRGQDPREDGAELREFSLVLGGEDEFRAHTILPGVSFRVTGWARARRCLAVRSVMPSAARVSSASSSARAKGTPSAVPCTSTNPPLPVITMFMSVSARTSSSYGRSTMGTPRTIPTETAATESVRTVDSAGIAPFSLPQATASARATEAPVVAAVRGPPSAWRTASSTPIVFSPRASVLMIARRERPMRREISWVRPPILPRTDSRSERVFVARGSIAYSAVTQPLPEPRRQRGTSSVKEAVH